MSLTRFSEGDIVISTDSLVTSTWSGNTIAVASGGTGTTTGSITGSGALTYTAGGSNTNVNLVPQGTGTVDVALKRVTEVGEPTQIFNLPLATPINQNL